MNSPTLSLFAVVVLSLQATAESFLPSSPLGIGHGGYNYWTSSPFANTVHTGSQWVEFSGESWGRPLFFFTEDGERNPQFNEQGLPLYLNENTHLRLLVWPFHHGEPGAPFRAGSGVGIWTVTWEGEADIRLATGTFMPEASNGAAKGSILNGRRVYRMASENVQGHLLLFSIDPERPLTALNVWLPDPAAPEERSLENHAGRWHPLFLEMLGSLDLAFQRFMDWNVTNGSPQKDWEDRRLPDHVFHHGVLNRRSVGPNGPKNRGTGMAYEYMVDLANATGNDMWICVPHLASDEFVQNLARLIRYGSDGRMPYNEPVEQPAFAPLRADLRVWVEHSNEIWSNGPSFPQGDWAAAQARELGITKPQFNARRATEVWRLFEQVFEGQDRLVRVGALWSGKKDYSEAYMRELVSYGDSFSPPQRPDILAPATYFGNGIQDWAHGQAILNRHREAGQAWFYTPEDFPTNPRRSEHRPVAKPIEHPYWQSPQFKEQLEATLLEWKQRIFSGATHAGGGFDTTGIGGGFPTELRLTVREIFGREIPLVSYEGGPSLYTDYLDGPSIEDDGLTTFINQLNRMPGFEEIYRIQLNIARSKGLESQGAFVDVGRWGKFGQWGHLEYLGQPKEESPKWRTLQAWTDEMQFIRPPTRALNRVPRFTTSGKRPEISFGASLRQPIEAEGGDGRLTFTLIGDSLCRGMTIAPDPEYPARMILQGTPTRTGWQYAYLRAHDEDGDAAWRIFGFEVVGGPGVLLDASLNGPITEEDLPDSQTRALEAELFDWSGLNIGASFSEGCGTAREDDGRGVQIRHSEAGLGFSVSQGNESRADSSLASAIKDDEYITFTLIPKEGKSIDLRHAAITLIWERSEYHAARQFSAFTSLSGWEEGDAIFTLQREPAMGVTANTRFLLPGSDEFATVSTPLEIRMVFYGSQWDHTARIFGLRVESDQN